ncbi:flagellar hook protein FlgE [Serratia proteamaculans]|uniref:flagellar hook protein FlgE n=1 Tax=Serratia proteamaculans TaxID=28151 RepID=UPI0021791D48|nr:flagellar hook protein FlgE [Serratia proteamaculans]CAI0950397.1 Flagellar hook protein flgE [Serratia proteamaculans]CAI1606815.1 Flagellar hook protein flgE [Serratia proteamaculans]CAI1717763.1 Flagellar hook protein flgE [Serratia proteamaculans]CAI1729352.1 Flagellar hook protein flgE [Serratia proteamaculans]CAI2439880.1 Flagellar hook protein flgE [Serratia proteamaculans]
MAFSQAVSGLNAAATNLDVIGNNIANSATSGFKSGSVSFADMFAGSQVGLGVKVAGITQNFKGGTTTGTSRALDVAISGNGFFRMQDQDGGIFYSRNGQFKLDENRNLTNMQGLQLTGYPAAGTPPTIQQGANPVPLSIPEGMMNAKASTSGTMVANLKSTHKVPDNKTFDPAKQDSYNYVNTITAYDSLGNSHNINAYFVKTDDNKWQVYTQDNPAAPVDAGTMTFDTSGNLTSTTSKQGATAEFSMLIPMSAKDGAPAQNLTLSFAKSMQQSVSADSVSKVSQDGYGAGEYTNFQINNDGTVVGIYSNQQTQVLGQIVMANFSNPEGLSSQGDNVWQETGASGQPRVGIAGGGGLGKLNSGALEASNVDLSQELVNMIVAQRNYQSNAQTIKTQDSILQTLVSLR